MFLARVCKATNLNVVVFDLSFCRTCRAAVQSEDAVPSSLRGMVEFSTPESTEAKL